MSDFYFKVIIFVILSYSGQCAYSTNNIDNDEESNSKISGQPAAQQNLSNDISMINRATLNTMIFREAQVLIDLACDQKLEWGDRSKYMYQINTYELNTYRNFFTPEVVEYMLIKANDLILNEDIQGSLKFAQSLISVKSDLYFDKINALVRNLLQYRLNDSALNELQATVCKSALSTNRFFDLYNPDDYELVTNFTFNKKLYSDGARISNILMLLARLPDNKLLSDEQFCDLCELRYSYAITGPATKLSKRRYNDLLAAYCKQRLEVFFERQREYRALKSEADTYF